MEFGANGRCDNAQGYGPTGPSNNLQQVSQQNCFSESLQGFLFWLTACNT